MVAALMTGVTDFEGAVWRRNKDVLEATQASTLILFFAVEGRYCDLDAVGSRIWNLLAEQRTLDDLVARLTTEYAVDAKTCKSDTLALLRMLAEKGFIVAELPK
jgi:hypothetical protein